MTSRSIHRNTTGTASTGALRVRALEWHLLNQLERKMMICDDREYHPDFWSRQIFRQYVRYL